MYKIIVKNGRIAGWIRGHSEGAINAPEEWTPDNASSWMYADETIKRNTEYHTKVASERISKVASARITDLTWRLERAEERNKIGAEGETVSDVMREREAIRRASNRAEAELEALTTIEEIEAFAWEVLPSDYPSNPVVTRLSFMRRFTHAERASIRAARDSGQSQDLLDFWELLQLATSVNLNDTDIKLGVDMLETDGLIGAGRAAEVLTL